jgi:hypothetical protein
LDEHIQRRKLLRHALENLIDHGREFRARVTRVLHLLRLHPAILQYLRGLPPGPHARLYTERRVRPLVHLDSRTQLRLASVVLKDFEVADVGANRA